MPCMLCKPDKNAPHIALCEACMEQICRLDAKRYAWYQSAVKRALFPSISSAASGQSALFPPAEGAQVPLSLPPVSLPAILDPEICLFKISES